MELQPDKMLLRGRLLTEYRTLCQMVTLYCRDHHKPWSGEPCCRCQALLYYAQQRLDRCPYGQQKPTCGKCPIHCYRKGMREEVRQVMGYAGPRMLLRHPLAALRHLWIKMRPDPQKPPQAASNRHQRKRKG
ncbi:nitrous oxide-stimulated promoter family protein [Dongshaea marina]|uniref:nitrous oxide-stimulated promoter family protein n=1 Tax=Dongshaea marina TaxID=2047966 RepID=UPI001F22C546|nr:nitrous oxide-stimulated promoter family protein [Dongshaea marina]